MKRITSLTLLLLLVAFSAFAQDLPRKSPPATVSQRIGLTEVSVAYARPAVQGRSIWGELVAYDEVWRTGANAATVIEFEDAAFLEGHLVPAGKYALFTIPGKDAFKVILNTEADQWGAYNRDPKLDLVTFSVPTEQTAKTEYLTFSFEELAYDNAQLCLAWDELKVCMKITTRTNAKSLATIQTMIEASEEGDYSPYVRAARFAAENKVMLDKAAEWAKTAMEMSDNNFDALWARARVYAAAEDYKNAVIMGEKCIAALSDDQRPRMETYIEGYLEGWRDKR